MSYKGKVYRRGNVTVQFEEFNGRDLINVGKDGSGLPTIVPIELIEAALEDQWTRNSLGRNKRKGIWS